MPRKAKDKELIEEKNIKKKSSTTKEKKATVKKETPKASKTASKKETPKADKIVSKKETPKASKTVSKKTTTKIAKTSKPTTKKTTTKKVSTKKTSTTKTKTTTPKKNKVTTPKKTDTKVAKTSKPTTKKTSTKTSKSTIKKTSTKAKSTTKKSTSRTKKKIENSVEVVEYYDLPYRYNETVVKVLAQTPNILFVYWDISDNDKQNYIKKYGEFFFNDTKPVLVIHNKTMNYSFEIDINDFANSWYLEVNDSNCEYKVELGRRPINEYAKIDNYLYISSSNEMGAPNDHILFDSLNDNVYFRNVKTNIDFEKNISLSLLTKIGKLYNVKDFYKLMYKDENIDFERLNLRNMPSS